jgi:hypothetical protein
LSYLPPGYTAWRNWFLVIVSWLLKSLKIRALHFANRTPEKQKEALLEKWRQVLGKIFCFEGFSLGFEEVEELAPRNRLVLLLSCNNF